MTNCSGSSSDSVFGGLMTICAAVRIPQSCGKKQRGSTLICDRNELWDALYTLPPEQAALIKCVSAGEAFHPISFERVRNTSELQRLLSGWRLQRKGAAWAKSPLSRTLRGLKKATPTHSG